MFPAAVKAQCPPPSPAPNRYPNADCPTSVMVNRVGPSRGDPGREIEGPLAIVILGGLVTSTALSLFVLPTLALAFGHFREGVAPDAACSA